MTDLKLNCSGPCVIITRIEHGMRIDFISPIIFDLHNKNNIIRAELALNEAVKELMDSPDSQ